MVRQQIYYRVVEFILMTLISLFFTVRLPSVMRSQRYPHPDFGTLVLEFGQHAFLQVEALLLI